MIYGTIYGTMIKFKDEEELSDIHHQNNIYLQTTQPDSDLTQLVSNKVG